MRAARDEHSTQTDGAPERDYARHVCGGEQLSSAGGARREAVEKKGRKLPEQNELCLTATHGVRSGMNDCLVTGANCARDGLLASHKPGACEGPIVNADGVKRL